MSRRSRRKQILTIVATDSTFERVTFRGQDAWQGACIQCQRRLLVDQHGEPIGPATVEHIIARQQGGNDDLLNLALACARCNHQKGYRLDDRRPDDPVLRRVTSALIERRRARWRDP
ncbi:MAG TPA: HNH endonuclease signature motif containing protein [Kofleriaceae bacterium]|nr:HNH endonuclease signature motif containing protein [Kofleriaceae bacterium]